MTKAALLKLVKKHCLDCCGTPSEVKLCLVVGCALYPIRQGKDPTPARRDQGKTENLRQGRKSPGI